MYARSTKPKIILSDERNGGIQGNYPYPGLEDLRMPSKCVEMQKPHRKRMGQECISVFLPVRNEEETIEQNLDNLLANMSDGRLSRRINYLAIVLDGSDDKSPEIVFKKFGLSEDQIEKLTKGDKRKGGLKRGTLYLHLGATKRERKGVVLIYHNKALGKGRAFMEAVFSLYGRTDHFRSPNSVLVNIDADCFLGSLKYRVKNAAIKISEELIEREEPMILGEGVEDSLSGSVARPINDQTGFRAIKAEALVPLIARHPLWVFLLDSRYGLEASLNRLIYPLECAMDSPAVLPVYETWLIHRQAYRHMHLEKESQWEPLCRVSDIFKGWSSPLCTRASDFAFSERVAELKRDPKTKHIWKKMRRFIDEALKEARLRRYEEHLRRMEAEDLIRLNCND